MQDQQLRDLLAWALKQSTKAERRHYWRKQKERRDLVRQLSARFAQRQNELILDALKEGYR